VIGSGFPGRLVDIAATESCDGKLEAVNTMVDNFGAFPERKILQSLNEVKRDVIEKGG
jgi:hypothetical protein